MSLMRTVAYIGKALDWINDQVYESLAVGLTKLFSWSLRSANDGNYAVFVLWSLVGAAAVIWFLLA
jgi:hypothetical protein